MTFNKVLKNDRVKTAEPRITKKIINGVEKLYIKVFCKEEGKLRLINEELKYTYHK